MSDIGEIFKYVTGISAVLMCVLILMQARGASLGAGFGGSSEIHTTRRGVDKTLHQFTIGVAVIFILSIILGLLI